MRSTGCRSRLDSVIDYRVSSSQLKFWLDERKTSIAAEKTRILDHRSEGKKEDYFYVFARSIARWCLVGFAEACRLARCSVRLTAHL